MAELRSGAATLEMRRRPWVLLRRMVNFGAGRRGRDRGWEGRRKEGEKKGDKREAIGDSGVLGYEWVLR